MTKKDARAAVVHEARTWLGTPYAHHARLKGIGVDCAMILAAVFEDAGMIQHFDPPDYPHDWHLHQHEERYVDTILALGAHEIAAAAVLPGDIVVWKMGLCYAHGGVVTGSPGIVPATGWPFVVHAYLDARMVIESNAAMAGQFTDPQHPRRFFSLWNAEVSCSSR